MMAMGARCGLQRVGGSDLYGRAAVICVGGRGAAGWRGLAAVAGAPYKTLSRSRTIHCHHNVDGSPACTASVGALYGRGAQSSVWRPPSHLCGRAQRLFSSAEATDVSPGDAPEQQQRQRRPEFGKLGGRAPKGARKRKARPTRKPVSVPVDGSVSPAELRALGKELGWDDEMIKNPDLLDILMVESARRQEDAARLKDSALYRALAGRLQAEFRTVKNLWNDTGGYGNKMSQFKPASAVRGPPPKSAKTLGADVPPQGEPITVDLGMVETDSSTDKVGAKEDGSGGGDEPSR